MFARLLSRLGMRRKRASLSRPALHRALAPALVIERISDPCPQPSRSRSPMRTRPEPAPEVFPVWAAFHVAPNPADLPEFAPRCLHLIRLLCERGELPWDLHDWFLKFPPTREHERVWQLFERAAVALLKAPEETDDDPITEEDIESLTLKFHGSRIIKEGGNR